MTPKQRVYTTLSHVRPDIIPWNIQFTEGSRNRMAAYLGDPGFESGLGNAIVYHSLRKAVGYRQIGPDIWEDEWGIGWDRSVDRDIGAVMQPILTPENFNDFPFPDPDDPARYADIPRLVEHNPDRFILINFGFALFERAWPLMGMENVLTAMIDRPDFLHRLMDRILEWNLRLIDNVCRFPVDAMIIGDDWGCQTGLLMGPVLWREFIKPRAATMYARIRSHRKSVFIHSCGDIHEIIPDLIGMGVDCFNPFQPDVMDIYDIKKRYGGKLSFYGGLSVQTTLPRGTGAEVRDAVRRLVEEGGEGGGLIAAPAHFLTADIPPENIMVMVETLQRQ